MIFNDIFIFHQWESRGNMWNIWNTWNYIFVCFDFSRVIILLQHSFILFFTKILRKMLSQTPNTSIFIFKFTKSIISNLTNTMEFHQNPIPPKSREQSKISLSLNSKLQFQRPLSFYQISPTWRRETWAGNLCKILGAIFQQKF